MPQHAEEKVSGSIDFLDEYVQRLCQSLVNCLVEPHHVRKILSWNFNGRRLPLPKHSRAKGTIFRNHLTNVEALALALARMAAGWNAR